MIGLSRPSTPPTPRDAKQQRRWSFVGSLSGTYTEDVYRRFDLEASPGLHLEQIVPHSSVLAELDSWGGVSRELLLPAVTSLKQLDILSFDSVGNEERAIVSALASARMCIVNWVEMSDVDGSRGSPPPMGGGGTCAVERDEVGACVVGYGDDDDDGMGGENASGIATPPPPLLPAVEVKDEHGRQRKVQPLRVSMLQRTPSPPPVAATLPETVLLARVAIGELMLVQGAIVDTLLSIREDKAFWNAQKNRRVRSFIEAGPLEWVRIARGAYDGWRGNGGGGGSDGSGVGARQLVPRLTPRRKVRLLSGAEDKLLPALGRVRRCLDAFFAVTNTRELTEATTRGLCTVEDVVGARVMRHDAPHVLGPQLTEHMALVLGGMEQWKLSWDQELLPLRKLSTPRRRWLQLTLLGCGAAVGLWFTVFRWNKVASMAASTRDWLHLHVSEPTKLMVDELIFDKTLEVSDTKAIKEAKASLVRMLSDYLATKNPDMSPEDVAVAAAAMDMDTIEKDYEAEIRNPVFNMMRGEVVRLILLQVQFIKKELLVAMGAIDQLMRESHFSVQMMAMMPAMIMSGAMYFVGRAVYRRFLSLLPDPRDHIRRIRVTMRDVDRALAALEAAERVGRPASDYACGTLVINLHRVAQLLAQRKYDLLSIEWERIGEDLKDLNTAGMSASTRRGVVRRMRATYTFLHPVARTMG